MPIISTKEQLIYLVLLLLPGFVVSRVRNVFTVDTSRSAYDELLIYIFGSILCNLVAAPAWWWILHDHPGFWGEWAAPSLILLIIPVLSGICWILAQQRGLLERVATVLGLTIVHHARTAWDWKFGRMRSPEWVLVTLKDGTEHAGYLGYQSFVASSRESRDIFLDQVYDINEDDIWSKPSRPKSILIPYSEINNDLAP